MLLKKVMTVYIILFAARVVGYLISGFLVILAEALHSLVDIVVLIVLKYASRISEKPADYGHPLGHGLARNLSSMVAGIVFITVVSLELFVEGFRRLLTPSEVYMPTFALSVMVGTTLVLLGVYLYSRKYSLPEEVAARFELKNDVIAGTGGSVGIALSTIYPALDGLLSMVIALIIAYNGFILFRSNAEVLLGMSPDDSFYARVRRIVEEFGEVENVHDIIATYMGKDSIHLDMHIAVRGDMTVREADELTEEIAWKLRKEMPEIAYAIIHVCAVGGEELRTTYDKIMKRIDMERSK